MVRPRSRASVLALALAAALGCARPDALPSVSREPDVDEGRRMYEKACAPCHGPAGAGDGARVHELDRPPGDLRTLSARHGDTYPRAYVLAVVTGSADVPVHDERTMPVWSLRLLRGTAPAGAVGSVYQRWRLEGLAAYVATLQEPAGAE